MPTCAAIPCGSICGWAKVRRLVTSLKSRKDKARTEVLDAAYWMKGCSSLGRLRYAVLLGVGKVSGSDDFCLIDIKEAIPAAAPRAARSHMPRNNARRVVEGARHLSPYLGERMMPARFLGRSVFIRELLPQDLKLEIDQLTREEAVTAARFLAAVVGTAHARQMDASTRERWRRTLDGHRSRRLDAPSWLWSSVVDLMVSHEAAYLEHCRRQCATVAVCSGRSRNAPMIGFSHSGRPENVAWSVPGSTHNSACGSA
jgi:uncharacterized protein (DUF2252 family)